MRRDSSEQDWAAFLAVFSASALAQPAPDPDGGAAPPIVAAPDAGTNAPVAIEPIPPNDPVATPAPVTVLDPPPAPSGYHATPVPDPYADVDLNVLRNDKYSLDVGGLGQILGLGQVVDDPYKDHARAYLFLPKARLRLDGNYGPVSFNFQLAPGRRRPGGRAEPRDHRRPARPRLQRPPHFDGRTYLKVGQFLVPYGREQLTDPGFQDFADTSMENIGFVVGRDVGLALVSKPGPVTLIGGVFTGGGRDVPPDHYLPEKIGIPLLVARASLGDLDADPFYLHQSDRAPDHLRYALSLSGLYTRDSILGHSTVLNVKVGR